MRTQADANRPPLGAGVAAVAILFFVNLTGYLDRQIMSLLVQPIKASLGLSDGDIGLLQGLAFVLVFSVASLFMGRFVDRSNRRNLLLVCVSIWTFATVVSGLARNVEELFIARTLVGIGEAALLPAAVSLIADFFEAERRGLAIGVFVTGTHMGIGLSLLLVGLALPSLEALAQHLAAQGAHIEAWRMVMVSMIVPGLLSCACLALMREPPRPADHVPRAISIADSFRSWAERRSVYLPHHVAAGCAALCLYAIAGWFPTVLIREHGYDASRAGISYGTISVLVNAASATAAGRVGDLLRRRKGSSARLSITALYCGISAVGFGVILSQPSIPILFITIAIVNAALVSAMVTYVISMSDMSPSGAQGQSSAILFLFTALIGNAAGPAIVGFANDLLGGAAVPLSAILSIVCLSACVVGIVMTRRSVRELRRENTTARS